MNLFHCIAHWKAGREGFAPDLRDAFLCVKGGILPLLQLVCIFQGVMELTSMPTSAQNSRLPCICIQIPTKTVVLPMVSRIHTSDPAAVVCAADLQRTCSCAGFSYRELCLQQSVWFGGISRGPPKSSKVSWRSQTWDCAAVYVLPWTGRQKNTQLYLFSLRAEMYSCT